ncbi:chordin [Trichomycterus rosablanca]|uniref:chordin n=1 Tax=Trichomycterus rosablanca TaxID=2290929 RepID=UPI002F359C29
MRGRRSYHNKAEPTHHSPDSEEPDEDVENNKDITPMCPLCGRGFDMPLLLPCSHTLCGRCLTQKARLDKCRPACKSSYTFRPICAVLCPRCCHAVELPCSDWSYATRCLPLYPTVTFDPEDEGGVRNKTSVIPGLMFALDLSTTAPPLQISNSALTATYKGIGDQTGDGDTRAPFSQVCGDVEIHRGQYYWEVDVCNSALYRIGVTSLTGDQAWWFERFGSTFHALFDGQREQLLSVPPQLKTVGVFLNVGGASITFHNPLTQELLAAIPSRFAAPLRPAFQLGQGRIKLRPGLPPPSHVFLSRNSTYRGPERALRGRWRQDVAFGSVTGMESVRVLLGLLCVLSCAPVPVTEASYSRMKSAALPIQPEREPLPSKGVSGCSFGGRFYSLEDTWHPDLGDPFGVMHCVMCHCEPQRSRRGKVFGKVSCRNIKQDCPEPNCDDSILLPGHCCKTCPKGDSDRKSSETLFDGFEFFQEKDDDLHKSYNDRSYLSVEHMSDGGSKTDFVALLTGVTDSWLPSSSGVARARFTLSKTNLAFSITYQRFARPSMIVFQDSEGNTAFEFKVPQSETDMICGVWRNLPKSHMRQLLDEQLSVSMLTVDGRREEIQGKIIKHRALFAETFSAMLSSEEEHSGMGGIAMLTLSDTENNLHFILLMRGVVEARESASPLVPIMVRLQNRQHMLREIHANVTAHDPDFAEVLTDLNSRELFWLSRGQLQIVVETQGHDPKQISGYITGKRSCDTLQSVMSSGDALTPGKTGGVGSAIFSLRDNGTLDYQVQVEGLTSTVVGVTIEMKPRRRSKRSVLYDVTSEFVASGRGGRAAGLYGRVEARHIHMLLQNELFINVATTENAEGELRGQIRTLLYHGLESNRHDLPFPLAGQLVSPPVKTGAGGHAWVMVDERCHLHYEIVVNGLGKGDDATVNAHLHGLAEIGEMDESASTGPKRLLTGFYGEQAQGVLKDLSLELLNHLNKGTAFIQVSTKMNPRGEIRGKIHVPNTCELGTRTEAVVEEAEFDDVVFVRDPEALKQDPLACFFEGERHTHGSRWTPHYNSCFTCTCQKKTVICDPVMCPPLACPHTYQSEDKCCPECDERKNPKEIKSSEKVDEHPEGCYFEGDQKMHAPGTVWHPFVPPFGYIKCAVCTCKGSTGEVHCEKVTCPALTCSRPIRRNPSDCCKECPAEDTPLPEEGEMMQADGPRHCKFGKNYYQNSENWHPRVPLVGEMKCITCWCDHGVTKCQRKQCPLLSCTNITRKEGKCCPECADDFTKEEEMKMEEKKKKWRH